MTTEETFQMELLKDVCDEMLIDIRTCLSTATKEELEKVRDYFISIFKMFQERRKKNDTRRSDE